MDAPERLDNGAVDPFTFTRMDLIPPRALLRVGATLHHGMKYEKLGGDDNWRKVPAHRHLDHAQRHIALFQSGDRSEDHVGHALTRMMMWADLHIDAGTATDG